MENNNFENEVMNEAMPATEPVAEEQPVAEAAPEVAEEQPAQVEQEVAPEAETVEQPVENVTVETGVTDDTVIYKSQPQLKKILIPVIAVALVIILAVAILPSVLGNTYKTPIDATYKAANAKKYDKAMDARLNTLNGFTEKEIKQMYKILEKSDEYEDYLDSAEEDFEDNVEDLKDEYGKNYKIKYKVEEKEKLEKEDLRDFRDQLRSAAESLEAVVDEAEDYDSDDWEDMADEIGLKKSEAKKLVKSFEKIAKKWKNADVTAGYEVEITEIITGSELDEPEEDDNTIYVYKVDGRWITGSSLYVAMMAF